MAGQCPSREPSDQTGTIPNEAEVCERSGDEEKRGAGTVTDTDLAPDVQSTTPPPMKRGPHRWLFVGLGCVFTGLAGIGVILPGIPTTPFLLVASYFFVRSSPRLSQRLLASRTFGPMLRDWNRYRGIKRSVKWVAVCGCTLTIGLSIFFGGLPWPGRVAVALAGAYGIWFVSNLPTVPDGTPR